VIVVASTSISVDFRGIVSATHVAVRLFPMSSRSSTAASARAARPRAEDLWAQTVGSWQLDVRLPEVILVTGRRVDRRRTVPPVIEYDPVKLILLDNNEAACMISSPN
jgi:hypothetical protein